MQVRRQREAVAAWWWAGAGRRRVRGELQRLGAAAVAGQREGLVLAYVGARAWRRHLSFAAREEGRRLQVCEGVAVGLARNRGLAWVDRRRHHQLCIAF